ncbi:MAG: hypothetical protein QOG14_1998 [Mycobacterium sp.]|jgi:hypothetical protein|nr:hypothetical protein [Mycobacterium sp.]
MADTRERTPKQFAKRVKTCERGMSFVTTTCVAGRIGDHGGYVGFRA